MNLTLLKWIAILVEAAIAAECVVNSIQKIAGIIERRKSIVNEIVKSNS